MRLPLEWYTRICRLIRQVCDCNFVLLSDGTGRELSAFLDEFKPVNSLNEPYSDLLDLLLLSKADLALCSNSTYARIGCFLNDRPYIWPADTLVKDPSGRYGYRIMTPFGAASRSPSTFAAFRLDSDATWRPMAHCRLKFLMTSYTVMLRTCSTVDLRVLREHHFFNFTFSRKKSFLRRWLD